MMAKGNDQLLDSFRHDGILCGVKGCDRPTRARGLCTACYKHLIQRNGSLADRRPFRPAGSDELLDRFEEVGSCLIWQGATNKAGYAISYLDGKFIVVHRHMWEKENGKIPEGAKLRRQCQNHACCNHKHWKLKA